MVFERMLEVLEPLSWVCIHDLVASGRSSKGVVIDSEIEKDP